MCAQVKIGQWTATENVTINEFLHEDHMFQIYRNYYLYHSKLVVMIQGYRCLAFAWLFQLLFGVFQA